LNQYSCAFAVVTNSQFLNITDEESVAMEEVKALGEAVQEVELSIQASDVDRNFDDFSFMSVKKEEPKKEPEQESSTSRGIEIGVNRTLMI
jgi:hypothetical protein